MFALYILLFKERDASVLVVPLKAYYYYYYFLRGRVGGCMRTLCYLFNLIHMNIFT